MCDFKIATCSDNCMDYLKGNTFNKSRDIGDLNV